MIGGAAVMVPSVTSAVYFVVFMASATYWSLNNSLGRRFGYGTQIVVMVHVAWDWHLCVYVCVQVTAKYEVLTPWAPRFHSIIAITSVHGHQGITTQSDLRTRTWAHEYTRARPLRTQTFMLEYVISTFEYKYLLTQVRGI